jgi:hypothetical protein
MEMESIHTPSTETAAFLVARGHRVVRTTRNGKEVAFHFHDTPKLRRDAESLRFGDDTVSARAIFVARNQLLDLIHRQEDFDR